MGSEQTFLKVDLVCVGALIGKCSPGESGGKVILNTLYAASLVLVLVLVSFTHLGA